LGETTDRDRFEAPGFSIPLDRLRGAFQGTPA
jgi:hypothetical protein